MFAIIQQARQSGVPPATIITKLLELAGDDVDMLNAIPGVVRAVYQLPESMPPDDVSKMAFTACIHHITGIRRQA